MIQKIDSIQRMIVFNILLVTLVRSVRSIVPYPLTFLEDLAYFLLLFLVF